MYRYNRAILDAYGRKLERLPWATVAKDRGATWHSMAGVYHHVVGVIDGWLNDVAQGHRAGGAMASRRWDTLASMREIRTYLEDTWNGVDEMLRGLTDAGLRRKVRAPWQPKACPLEDAFHQVTFEIAHHLGEIIAMMWQEDIRPPEMTWLGTNWKMEARRPRAGTSRN